MDKELELALKEHGEGIDTKLQDLAQKYTDGEKATQDEIAALKAEVEKYKSLQTQLDEQNIELKKMTVGQVEKRKTFEKSVEEMLSTDEYKSALQSKGGKFSFSVKAAATMLESTNLTGEVIPATVVPGVVYDPVRGEHARDIITGGTTSSNLIRFVKESGYEDGANVVAEGDASGLTDFDLVASETSVKTIATHLVISKDMLDDIPYIASYISQRVPSKLKVKEDSQVLYGDGLGDNLDGLLTNAADLVPGTFATAGANAVTDPSLIDLLGVAMNQIRVGEYRTTRILLHPTDITAYRNVKATDGHYLDDPRVMFQNGRMLINGVPVWESTAITSGTYAVGDFGQGAQLFDRKSLEINFYEQDSDNAKKRLVTIEMNERLALVNYRPAAFVTGTIATDIAAIAAA